MRVCVIHCTRVHHGLVELAVLKASLLNDRLAYQKETQAVVRDLELNAKKVRVCRIAVHV